MITVKTWKLISVSFFVLSIQVTSFAQFYVATDGNDNNPGTLGQPWRTIQHAANTVSAGNTVIVLAGTYFERVTFPTSGTAGNPITFQGQRSGDQWLTIVDGSDATSGWSVAGSSGDGNNYYRTNSIGYNAGFMSSNAEMIMRIHHQATHPITGDGFDVFSWNSDFIYSGSNSNENNPNPIFWDVFYAAWGRHTGDGFNYIRFQNGQTPATMDVRSAPEDSAVFNFNNDDYIVIRDFQIQNAMTGVWMNNSANDVTVRDCYLTACEDHFVVENNCDNIVIDDNVITSGIYGEKQTGAWEYNQNSSYVQSVSESSYRFGKYWWAIGSGSATHAVYVNNNVGTLTVTDNDISSGRSGVDFQLVTNLTLARNTIYDFTSTGALVWGDLPITAYVHDNHFRNCNINLRVHHVDDGGTDTIIYIYRNRFELYWEASTHIFFHSNVSQAVCLPQIFIYHNSFSGSANNVYHGNSNYMPNTLVINNIFSARRFWFAFSNVYQSLQGLDWYDYNWYTGSYSWGIPDWLGNNNFDHSTGGNPAIGDYFWDPRVESSFQIPSGIHEVVDAAIDITQTFTVNGTNYSALPGFAPGWWSGDGPDIGAVEFGGGTPSAPGKVKKVVIVFH